MRYISLINQRDKRTEAMAEKEGRRKKDRTKIKR
jgi:hypothetical protein